MSIELTTQITASHTTEKEWEEHGCATWKAKCSNYNLTFYGDSYEEVIEEACEKIKHLYTVGNLQLVNQRGLKVREETQKVVVEVSIGINPNTTLDMFQDEEGGEARNLYNAIKDLKDSGVSIVEFRPAGEAFEHDKAAEEKDPASGEQEPAATEADPDNHEICMSAGAIKKEMEEWDKEEKEWEERTGCRIAKPEGECNFIRCKDCTYCVESSESVTGYKCTRSKPIATTLESGCSLGEPKPKKKARKSKKQEGEA